jgi:hypothetical protein
MVNHPFGLMAGIAFQSRVGELLGLLVSLKVMLDSAYSIMDCS